jgi:thiamine biosynthesis lipoprotein
MQRALVNGGGSSIAALGAPPGQQGWPVQIGPGAASETVLLRDSTISTSQQTALPFSFAPGSFGEIVDPHSGNPSQARMAVSVLAGSATVGDALSTALVVLSATESDKLLAKYDGVTAVWVSDTGERKRSYGAPRLQHAERRP